MLTASPSSFVLHANDTRDTLLTVTNPTGATSGMPMLSVSGLTLGTMMFSQSTCTSNLAPGARIMPTGGIPLSEVGGWLAAGAVAVGVGSDLTASGAIAARVEEALAS